jgi:hypothetical protein
MRKCLQASAHGATLDTFLASETNAQLGLLFSVSAIHFDLIERGSRTSDNEIYTGIRNVAEIVGATNDEFDFRFLRWDLP